MRKPMRTLWWLTCALAIAGCASSGKAVCPPPVSPLKLQPVPAELMTPPTYYQQASDEFLESSVPAKPTSKASKPY